MAISVSQREFWIKWLSDKIDLRAKVLRSKKEAHLKKLTAQAEKAILDELGITKDFAEWAKAVKTKEEAGATENRLRGIIQLAFQPDGYSGTRYCSPDTHLAGKAKGRMLESSDSICVELRAIHEQTRDIEAKLMIATSTGAFKDALSSLATELGIALPDA